MKFQAVPWVALLGSLLAAAPSRASELGHVVYIGFDALYLDVGSLDGLALGDVLSLRQRARSVGSCRVISVSAHAGRCSKTDFVGQASFLVPREAPKTTAPSKRIAPQIFTAAARERFIARLAKSPMPRVTYRPSGVRRAAHRVRASWASLSHDGWMVFNGQARRMQRERLDVGLVGVRLSERAPVQGSVRLTGLVWSAEDQLTHYRPNTPAQLYVWQAQLDNLRRQEGLIVTAGRVLPAYVPGIAVLDGGQLGYGFAGGQVEVGGYAGFLPNLMTLAPSDQRWTIGVYNKLAWQSQSHTAFRNLMRLGYVNVPDRLGRAELETVTDIAAGTAFHLGFNPRFGLLAATGRPVLSAARVNMSAKFRQLASLYASMRYATPDVDVVSGVADYAWALRTTVASQASITALPRKWLSLAAQNAIAWDRATATLHVLTGPEVGFPLLFGKRGGISFAYLAESGSKSARSAFFQGQLRLTNQAALLLRSSYFEDRFQIDNLLREISFYAGIHAQVSSQFALDLSALTRHGLHNARVAGDAPTTLRTTLKVTGRF